MMGACARSWFVLAGLPCWVDVLGAVCLTSHTSESADSIGPNEQVGSGPVAIYFADGNERSTRSEVNTRMMTVRLQVFNCEVMDSIVK